MARARVELRDSVSYVIGGRVWKKRKPQILTNDSEIAKYKTIGGFSVTMLDEEAKPKPKTKASVVTPPPVDDDAVSDADEVETYAESDLKKLNRAQLVKIGNELGLDLDAEAKKADLIDEILEAQEE